MAHEAISHAAAGGSDAPITKGVRFAIFAAGNREAIHLLESIKYAVSPYPISHTYHNRMTALNQKERPFSLYSIHLSNQESVIQICVLRLKLWRIMGNLTEPRLIFGHLLPHGS